MSWPRSFVSRSPLAMAMFGLAAGGVEVVGVERGFGPGGGERSPTWPTDRRRSASPRRGRIRLRAFPFAALDRDHARATARRTGRRAGAAREIVVGRVEPVRHVVGGAAQAEEDGILFEFGPLLAGDLQNAERFVGHLVAEIEASKIEHRRAALGGCGIELRGDGFEPGELLEVLRAARCPQLRSR